MFLDEIRQGANPRQLRDAPAPAPALTDSHRSRESDSASALTASQIFMKGSTLGVIPGTAGGAFNFFKLNSKFDDAYITYHQALGRGNSLEKLLKTADVAAVWVEGRLENYFVRN